MARKTKGGRCSSFCTFLPRRRDDEADGKGALGVADVVGVGVVGRGVTGVLLSTWLVRVVSVNEIIDDAAVVSDRENGSGDVCVPWLTDLTWTVCSCVVVVSLSTSGVVFSLVSLRLSLLSCNECNCWTKSPSIVIEVTSSLIEAGEFFFQVFFCTFSIT